MSQTDYVGIQISRSDAGFIIDILDVRAEQYEITADYYLQNEMCDEDEAEELREYVEGLTVGFDHEDSICDVNDGHEAMSIAKSIRALQAKLEAALS